MGGKCAAVKKTTRAVTLHTKLYVQLPGLSQELEGILGGDQVGKNVQTVTLT
jgi:hypothetical protein